MAVHDEILYSDSLATLAEARFPIVPLAAQYIRPTLTTYLQDVLSEHVIRVVEAPNLDLCTDPVEVSQCRSTPRVLVADGLLDLSPPYQCRRKLYRRSVSITERSRRRSGSAD